MAAGSNSSSINSHSNGSAASPSAPAPPSAAAPEASAAPTEVEGDRSGSDVTSGIDAVLERLLRLSPDIETDSTSAAAVATTALPFERLIESEQGRAYFLQQLNDQRGRGSGDVGAGYGGLARCFQLLLGAFFWGGNSCRVGACQWPTNPRASYYLLPTDKCQAAHDVRAAQQALALANTFFREQQQQLQPTGSKEKEREREYLLPLVKAHPLWRDRRQWEDSLMLSVADQLELCPQVKN